MEVQCFNSTYVFLPKISDQSSEVPGLVDFHPNSVKKGFYRIWKKKYINLQNLIEKDTVNFCKKS